MKNLFAFLVLIFLLLGIVFAISSFLGGSILVSLRSEFNKNSFSVEKERKLISQFAVLSDSHADNENTKKAVDQAKALKASYLLHSGDWTTVGTIDELSKQKAILDSSKLPYFGVMGDHDRWQSGSKNFEKVFGKIYESFDKDRLHFILLDTSDLVNGFGKEQLDWFEADLKENRDKPILIFMHLPVYHSTSDRTIAAKGGSSTERDGEVKRFLSIIKGKNIIVMFSGDHHFSETYTEPSTGVKIVIVGAITRSRNLQTPRFDMVYVYDDLTITVKEEVIN